MVVVERANGYDPFLKIASWDDGWWLGRHVSPVPSARTIRGENENIDICLFRPESRTFTAGIFGWLALDPSGEAPRSTGPFVWSVSSGTPKAKAIRRFRWFVSTSVREGSALDWLRERLGEGAGALSLSYSPSIPGRMEVDVDVFLLLDAVPPFLRPDHEFLSWATGATDS